MKVHLTQDIAERIAKRYTHLIGKPMLDPYEGLPITSITVEKSKTTQGFDIILSHDIFDGGWPEVTGFKCPQTELLSYLAATGGFL